MEVIDKANDAHVLMKLLCNKMDLTTKCTHIQFVEKFSKLQGDARKFEMELRDIFKEAVQKETQKTAEMELINSTETNGFVPQNQIY